jgi:hypothetical protein
MISSLNSFNSKRSSRLSLFTFFVLVFCLALLFWKSFFPGSTLASGDAPKPYIEQSHRDFLPWGHLARWDNSNALGIPGGALPIAPGYLLSYVVPFAKYTDANYLLHLFLLGLFSYLFLHDITRNRAGALLGGIWMMLQPHVLSHILPGHVGHLMMMGWIPGVFWLVRIAVRSEHWALWGLAGGVFGIALNSTVVDVGLFWALLIAAYGLFLIIRKYRRPAHPTPQPAFDVKSGLRLGRNLILAAILALMTGYQSIVIVMGMEARGQTHTPDITQQNPEKSAKDKWFWATQWSVPVEELIDCAIPGFFGWGSSNPQNPYRGRVGQTEGFPLHRQGMPNLNDVSIYLGAVILLAALLAFYLDRRNGELWFFAIAGILACLLSFGKYAPFYKLFYWIPHMDAMRNPIKWFYLTSFCVGVAGTLGFNRILAHWQNPRQTLSHPALLAWLEVPILLVLGAGSWYLSHIADDPNALFWQYPALRQLSKDALVVGGAIWIAAGLVFGWILWPRRAAPASAASSAPRKVLLPALLIGAILLGELVYVNRHYLPYKSSAVQVQGGPLADFLNNQPKPFRIKIVGEEPIFQYIRQMMTLYYRWEHIEPTVSRTLDDFALFMQALSKDPKRLFQMTNVRYIIGPAGFRDPLMKPVESFTAGKTSVVIYQFMDPLARYYLVPSWRPAPVGERFQRLADPDFDPKKEVWVHAEASVLPPVPAVRASRMSCRIDQYRWNYIKLTVETDQPAMLVGLDRFDTDWKARLNGVPLVLYPANAMLRACPIPPGRHTVEMELIGQGASHLTITFVGMFLCLIFIPVICSLKNVN